MSRKDDEKGLANSSLSTSRVPAQNGTKPDGIPTTRNLPGNDQQKGLDAVAKPPVGTGARKPQQKKT